MPAVSKGKSRTSSYSARVRASRLTQTSLSVSFVRFFFDVETVDIPKWSGRLRIISRLRKLRKKHGIRIRLLMTTGVLNTGSCYTMSIWHRLSAQLRTRSVC